jgi:cytochrome c peroxidase
MKSLKMSAAAAVLIFLGASVLFAAQYETSIAKGKALFNDAKLGTSGKACATCHPEGSGLEKAGTRSNLAEVINTCISKPLQGKPLDVTSPDMQSLVLYIKFLGQQAPK